MNPPGALRAGTTLGLIYADISSCRVGFAPTFGDPHPTTYGANGDGRGQFGFPYGLSLDAQGRVLVAEPRNNRIVRFDGPTGKAWTALATTETHPLLSPSSIATDSKSRICFACPDEKLLVRIDDLQGTGWTVLKL
jgi:hypothetical protein